MNTYEELFEKLSDFEDTMKQGEVVTIPQCPQILLNVAIRATIPTSARVLVNKTGREDPITIPISKVIINNSNQIKF